ncbi:TAT-variant-translocated molybdopterin oxidoreductase [Lutimonas zeaxanthinifaciens]|uniref:TAT-variant-translocated molybdopterin oxidoreductase n=1 Tax=Lutimonas zeaxanthinifaciens TaxID=3060215 RepID=UPI00265CBD6D|nr:TAT-variant-translocated molybdopterin oxidoreductase [Lutimonas sp. YSD2104]WKK65421.1 TAT-variant-translocated molybdopterin oxidoreductase [Lutimonas sp. YSD2104]
MASNKKYWKSVEELKENSSIVEKLQKSEFIEDIPTDKFLGDKETLDSGDTSRRDFLKYVGFSTAVASLAACEGPVVNSIPYVVKPDDLIPGIPDYYASSIADGFDFANILVKVREGRPIKIEPNKDSVNGITNARVQASVLSLYDNNRLRGPLSKGENTDYGTLDKEVKAQLETIKANGGKIVLLTGSTASPSLAKLAGEFKEAYGNVEHIAYDAVNEDAALNAFQKMYGQRVLPDYDFSKAEVIVSVGADFLGDWQGGNFSAGYAKGRKPKNGKMSRHIQFESNMTLSGGNSDKRIVVKPSEQLQVMSKLYEAIVNGKNSGSGPVDDAVGKAVAQIKKAGKNAVVITGVQDENAQLLALAINAHLQSAVIDVNSTKNVRQGDTAKVDKLIKDMAAGGVDAVFISNINPVYSLSNGPAFAEALKNVSLSVAFTMSANQTSELAQYVVATPHFLESWGDVEIKKGHYGLTQPTIKPLFNTRQLEDTLLAWNGSDVSYYDYIKSHWQSALLGGKSWNKTLQEGTLMLNPGEEVAVANELDMSAASAALAQTAGSEMELTVYAKTGLGDGQQANNPWLQELPDPITRTSWDNYLLISRIDAERLGLSNRTADNGALDGDLVNVVADGVTLNDVPVYIQPGQAAGSVAIAVGYGRTDLKNDMKVGINAYPLSKGAFQSVSIEKTAGEHEFACVQLHHTIMGREGEITKETTLEDFVNKPKEEWNHAPVFSLDHQEVTQDKVDLWEKFDDSLGTKFNLSVDLATCTGCAACVVSCHAENNVPVVGKHEIRVSRDMHWLRIDRYYSSDTTVAQGKEDGTFGTGDFFKAQGEPSDAPEVSFQPVMCQHCNHAPCETVCPVAATSHGRQGQNQMAYNRCIGTRYCANNCPYRVRRFNWFKYANNNEFDFNMNNELGRMVLNPDVTVRSRGVMEKCSFCIQKTQLTILNAKKEGRAVKDGEFSTACSDACPNGSLVFGDVNDESSKVAHLSEDDRSFKLLDFVGTKPNVFYQLKVKNTNEA